MLEFVRKYRYLLGGVVIGFVLVVMIVIIGFFKIIFVFVIIVLGVYVGFYV